MDEETYGREMAKLVAGEQERHRQYLHPEEEEDDFFEIQGSHKRLLKRLARGSVIGLTDYAHSLRISPQAVRQTARGLVRHGYVETCAPAVAGHGRAKEYAITQKGREVLNG